MNPNKMADERDLENNDIVWWKVGVLFSCLCYFLLYVVFTSSKHFYMGIFVWIGVLVGLRGVGIFLKLIVFLHIHILHKYDTGA